MRGLMQENLFDVEEISEINAEIKKVQHQKENELARQSLQLMYYEHPKNDNEKLMNYQFEYLKNGSADAWGNLIELAFVVTKRLIWRWMRDKKIVLDEIEQDEKTSIAVEYVLRRYNDRIGYAITKNYIKALNDGVTHAMLYITKLEQNTCYIEDTQKQHSKDYGELENEEY